MFSFVVSSTKLENKRTEHGGMGRGQIMYTQISKCKNDKIKSFLMRKRYE
jgi:hypothetical protein